MRLHRPGESLLAIWNRAIGTRRIPASYVGFTDPWTLPHTPRWPSPLLVPVPVPVPVAYDRTDTRRFP